MHMTKSFPFVQKETFKALQMPYKGEEISMLILLPNSLGGLDQLESELTSDFFKQLKSKMHDRKVKVALPKFRLECSKSLEEDFQSLGMNLVFRPSADFEGISDSKGLMISKIIHKAVLIVNEEGSEAAAATAIVFIRSLSLDPEFIVDHPFVFLIYNSKTDLILFMGKVVEL